MRRIVLFGITLLVAMIATGLGFWQLGRLRSRRAANRIAIAERGKPPLNLTDPGVAAVAQRRAVLRGALDEADEFILRGRVVMGVPAVQVVTPLRIPGRDTAVLVNRGYVPAPDATNPDAEGWSEPDTVQLAGVLLPVPDRGDGAPLVDRGRETWQALDLNTIRKRLPFPILSVYLLAEADSGQVEHTVRGRSYPIRASPPPLDEGPHLSYAIQWFGIAAAVLAFGIFFVLRSPASRIIE